MEDVWLVDISRTLVRSRTGASPACSQSKSLSLTPQYSSRTITEGGIFVMNRRMDTRKLLCVLEVSSWGMSGQSAFPLPDLQLYGHLIDGQNKPLLKLSKACRMGKEAEGNMSLE